MANITIYGRPGCASIYTVRRELERNGVDYEYIDIWDDPSAAETVRQINNGYESVPTLVFPDGTTLTEPSTSELVEKLRISAEGVELFNFSRLLSILSEGPTLRLLATLFVLAGIFADLQILTWIGLALLAISFLVFFRRKAG